MILASFEPTNGIHALTNSGQSEYTSADRIEDHKQEREEKWKCRRDWCERVDSFYAGKTAMGYVQITIPIIRVSDKTVRMDQLKGGK